MFPARSAREGGKRSRCKVCTREVARQKYHRVKSPDDQRVSNLKKAFGITVEAWDKMYQDQNGLCAICARPQSEFSRRFAVDHDHTTGDIRGLLCMFCNTGLGKFQDSPAILGKAIAYLNKKGRKNGHTES